MKYLLLLLSMNVCAETIKIAVIDTGYNPKMDISNVKLCKTGHYDFASKSSKVGYSYDHGTIVAEIIADELKDKDYCLIIYQVAEYAEGREDAFMNGWSIGAAVAMARAEGARVINLSVSGGAPADQEKVALEIAVNNHVGVFVASGNDNSVLSNDKCETFPACYKIKGLHVVGATENRSKCAVSNYGPRITDKADGTAYKYGDTRCATSYATPRALSAYVLRHYAELQKPINTQTHATRH